MDKHRLTPLFSPASIVVFAGDPEVPGAQTPYARAVLAELKSTGFAGTVIYLDSQLIGTLANLVQSRADLALIALPHEQITDALEVAGRIHCRAALVLCSGLPAGACENLLAIAKRHGLHLLGPNSLGFQRPQLKFNASAAGALAAPGPLALVSQSGALTASILDAWPRATDRWASGWRSSPTAAAPACWRPTRPTRSGWTWPRCRTPAAPIWRPACPVARRCNR